ncbi:MAG TPA: RsmE family RNA methyltransferase, partial [Ramlibacter sp.]
RVPQVHEPAAFAEWIDSRARLDTSKIVLSLSPEAVRLSARPLAGSNECICLSGPEGGLEPREESAAAAAGFVPVTLGSRVLRADTAPIALLSALVVR